MATVYSFGPFQLDDKSEILFRGKEPTTVGQRAVAPGQQGRVAGYFRHRAAIPRLLAAITDVAVDDSLAATTALDLVRRGDRSESYAFKHVLVCDALYAGLLSAQRTAVHLKIARELSRVGRVKNDPKRRYHALRCLAKPRYASFMTSTADGN